MCTNVLRQTADHFAEEFPLAACKVKESFYVDNFLDSFDTVEEAATCCLQVTKILRRGGFKLTRWLSSSRELLSKLPASDLINSQLVLDNEPLPIERNLGVFYDAERDFFSRQT